MTAVRFRDGYGRCFMMPRLASSASRGIASGGRQPQYRTRLVQSGCTAGDHGPAGPLEGGESRRAGRGSEIVGRCSAARLGRAAARTAMAARQRARTGGGGRGRTTRTPLPGRRMEQNIVTVWQYYAREDHLVAPRGHVETVALDSERQATIKLVHVPGRTAAPPSVDRWTRASTTGRRRMATPAAMLWV